MDTWTIRRLLQWCTPWLSQKGCDSPRLDGELLLAEVLNLERITLYLDPDRPLTAPELAAFKALVKRRAQREPVALILGRRDFWQHTFKVAPGVLIPRPETEGLLEAVIEHHPDRQAGLTMLEIGVGSGAVLCSLLAEYPRARGVGSDISATALTISRENAVRIAVSDRLRLLSGDLTAPLAVGERFDLIVSNPPYIASPVLKTLAPEVARWEPIAALDGGGDGLAVLRRLAAECAGFLQPGGLLALEIGHDQAEAVSGLLAAAGYESITVRPDYGGQPRIVTALHAAG